MISYYQGVLNFILKKQKNGKDPVSFTKTVTMNKVTIDLSISENKDAARLFIFHF